jgi:hypothetical protein
MRGDPVGNGEYKFGIGGWRASSDLDKAIAGVRELGAVLLEARDCCSSTVEAYQRDARLAEIVERCAALGEEVRAWGLPLVDPGLPTWISETVSKAHQPAAMGFDKDEILRLANLVVEKRRKFSNNRVVGYRETGGSNRPVKEVVESVPLSVVPRITTLEAALRLSQKIKQQLIQNERIAALAQTAKLSPSVLSLLDLNKPITFD